MLPSAQPASRTRSAIGILFLVASCSIWTAHAQTADPNYLDAVGNDVQIFNYFLNLEYLLAEFYSCAATGQGIPAAARGGGPASTGCQQATLTGPVAEFAAELAENEYNHVVYYRNALGDAASPIPPLDISGGSGGPVTLFASITGAGSAVGAFASFVDSALGKTLSPPFTPYDSNLDFLLGAYILEDVLVTAYESQIRYINDTGYRATMEGVIAAEGYHAGGVRELLIQQAGAAVSPYGLSVNQVAQAISNYRATLDGTRSSDLLKNDDQWILNTTSSTPVLVPSNGYTFERTPWQVIQIYTGGASDARGLFFPSGLNTSSGMNGTNKDTGIRVPAFTINMTADFSIFAFALNLEYLESDFYSWLVYGKPINGRGFCPGSGCPVAIGAKQGNMSANVRDLLAEIAAHEYDHAAYFQTKSGNQAFTKPQLNFTTFAAIANAAMGTTLDPPFDPFADDMSALIAAYILEDVGVTAYKNAVPAISDRSYLRGGSGICALEAYHGGAVRMQLLQNSSAIIQPWGVDALTITQKISALRASAAHANDDIGVSVAGGRSTVVNADENSIIWGRTPAQVVNIVTLGSGTGVGGFFPDGLKGVINGTAGSGAAAANLPPVPAAPVASPAPAPTVASPAPVTGSTGPTAARAPSRSPSSGTSGASAAAPTAAPTAAAPTSGAAPAASIGSLILAAATAVAVATAFLA